MVKDFLKTYKKYILMGIIVIVIFIGYTLYKNYRISNRITELSINTPEYVDGIVGAYYSPDGIIVKYKKGSQIPIEITYVPANTKDKKVEYFSTDKSVIGIDKNGVITAKKSGTAEIYIVSKSDEAIKSNSITIEVID